MTGNMLQLSFAKALALSRKTLHRQLMFAAMALDLVLALGLALFPHATASMLAGLALEETSLVRASGVLLLMTLAYRILGGIDSFRWRWPNAVAVSQHATLAFVFAFGSGYFPLLAAIQLAMAVSLAIFYYNYLMAELMSRP